MVTKTPIRLIIASNCWMTKGALRLTLPIEPPMTMASVVMVKKVISEKKKPGHPEQRLAELVAKLEAVDGGEHVGGPGSGYGLFADTGAAWRSRHPPGCR